MILFYSINLKLSIMDKLAWITDVSGLKVQRSDFGLPANWSRVQDWLSFNGPVVIPFEKPAAVPELKWSNIPILNDYRVIPDESFWKDFPKRDLPSTAETKINVENLEEKVNSLSGKLYSSQFERARRALN
jgi:hypothetical protein